MTFTAILAVLGGFITREIIQYIGGLISAYLKKAEATSESDAAIDQHAKDVTKEMETTNDPSKMDKADSDLLSGR